jgi:flagellar hook-length control protein FliK
VAAEPVASGGDAVEPMHAGAAGIELAAQAEAGELAGGPSKAGVSNTAALESPAPAMAAPQAAAAAGAQAAGPGSPIPLSTPVDSPDFSQALASQLTTLARNGVHEAELQLNPADMGPISVQITLDGSQAQIDFAAAHARTREVLEAAWPALAASLHGAGLTLGGGGVSDQRPGARGEGDASGGRGRQSMTGADDGVAASGRSVRIDAQRGLLDLYA